ncbi:MAG: methyltransferase domain-containing protein [Verrucomicrobia bacterium]|nr:methyltransferase domain-containing protein [Verrucomicrobiota bacterium]
MKILRDRRTKLNYQYRQGGWAWLDRLDEQGHHFVLAGYFRRLKPGGAVLDLGCGEGVWNDALGKESYSYYEGVDLADEAARLATTKRGDTKTRFFQGDFDTYRPARGSFDAVVVNEALYYSRNPVACLRRYEPYLAKDGVFLISLLHRSSDAIWEKLYVVYDFLDENVVTNLHKTTWICRVLRSRAVGANHPDASTAQP